MIYNKKAFTIIELLVWVAIISIITLWITNLYSSKIPDRQRLDIFASKVISKFDTIKNYSLVWKWVWKSLVTPKYYLIELSKSGSYLKSFYNTWWINNIYYDQMSLYPFWESYKIHSIKCKNLDSTNTSIINKLDLKYEGANITLSWCIDDFQKVIEIELYYKGFKNLLRLNTISWVLESIKKY